MTSSLTLPYPCRRVEPALRLTHAEEPSRRPDRKQLTGFRQGYLVRKSVTNAQRQDAVALAAVVGIEAAASQLGWDRRTVRSWCEKAGKRPELDGSAAGWTQLLDLAQSQVATALASGKVRPKDAAVIAAIAERNLRQLVDREKRTPEPQEPWADRFDRWCDETYPSRRLAEIAKDLPTHVLRYELQRRSLDDSLTQDDVENRTGPIDDSFGGE